MKRLILILTLYLTTFGAFSQSGKVVKRDIHYDDEGLAVSIFLAFSLQNHPAYPDESGYWDYWIKGAEFTDLPAREPSRETAIQAIIQREIENSMVYWEESRAKRRKVPTDDLKDRVVDTKNIDLRRARARVAKNRTTTTTIPQR